MLSMKFFRIRQSYFRDEAFTLVQLGYPVLVFITILGIAGISNFMTIRFIVFQKTLKLRVNFMSCEEAIISDGETARLSVAIYESQFKSSVDGVS